MDMPVWIKFATNVVVSMCTKLIVACFKKGNKSEVREFGATTRELLDMAEWLQNGGCEMIAMESTPADW